MVELFWSIKGRGADRLSGLTGAVFGGRRLNYGCRAGADFGCRLGDSAANLFGRNKLRRPTGLLAITTGLRPICIACQLLGVQCSIRR